MEAPRSIVLVGSGPGGTKAAEGLRESGYDGSITLVTADPRPPYARPPLSKAYLRGELELERFTLKLAEGVDLRLSTRVTAIDPQERTVDLEGGERIRYDRLLLATGAEPRRLSVPGADLDGVLYLRDVADSDAIREHTRAGRKAVVVGAGFIGSEVAASLRQLGLDVTLIEGGRLPLERFFGREIGEYYRDLHLSQGVEVLTDARLERFEGNGRVERAVLADGRAVECDFAVVGIGVTARTELAERAGLQLDDGVVVDERLETSASGIFAAGDIAKARHPFYGGHLRVEHWWTGAYMGPVAAKNMLGQAEPYDRIPYFYSDQYDSSMEYSGFAPDWDDVVFRGDPASGEFMAFWLADRRLVAGMNVNIGGVTEQLESLIRAKRELDPARLRDPDTPLEQVSPEPVARGRNFFAEGINFTRRFIGDRVKRRDKTPTAELASGEARVLTIDGDRVAAYRDDGGALHVVSAVCTHMRCLVEWNADDRTWDCPCHGSRFDVDGKVLNGPAKRELEAKAGLS